MTQHKIMKIIGWIVIFPFMCILAPFLFLAACVSTPLEDWLEKSE